MNDALSVETKLHVAFQGLPCVADKFIVDLVNNIDVSRDHIRVQNSRSSAFRRLYDSVTGQGTKRQNEINAALTDSMDAAITCLTQLAASQERSNLALVRLNNRIAKIQQATTIIANYSADTRERLEQLARFVDARYQRLEQELRRIDFEQRAHHHLVRVFNRWAAGKFAGLSPAGRCYAVLEELRWGDFGDYCRTQTNTVRRNVLDDIINRAIIQLRVDTGINNSTTRMSIKAWMDYPIGIERRFELEESIVYMGDWSRPETQPFVFTVSQQPSTLPLALPRRCSAERLSESIVPEVMEEVL